MLSKTECLEIEKDQIAARIRRLELAEEARSKDDEHLFQAIPDLRGEPKERGVLFFCDRHTANAAYQSVIPLPDHTQEQALLFVTMIGRKLENICGCGHRETAILYGYGSGSEQPG